MKSKIIIWLAVFLISISACTAQATPIYVEAGPLYDEILANTDVILQNILTGIQNKDYDTYTKDFSEKMKDAAKPADVDKIFAMFDVLGNQKSIEAKSIQEVGEYYSVTYEAVYELKTISIRLVVKKDDLSVLSGLWFK